MLKTALMAGLLAVSGSAWAAVDWTPYLKGMTDGCNYPNFYTSVGGGKIKLPKKLQSSVSKYSTFSHDNGNYGDNIYLKNAVAFGQPITRITRTLMGVERESLTIYFANTKYFNKLKSEFALVDVNGKRHAVGKKQYFLATPIPTEEIDKDWYEPIHVLSYKPISQQQVREFEKKAENEYPNPSLDNSYIVYIQENGWSMIDGTDLSFNPKNKSVTCLKYK